MISTFNLPPGATLRDIDPPSAIPEGWHECPECGRITFRDGERCFACRDQAERDAAQEAERKETNEH